MDNKDVFISYRREDGRDFAQLMADRLEALGYSVYFDREMKVGEHFPSHLENAIKNANDFLMVVSPSYWGVDHNNIYRIAEDEDWVHQEIFNALKYNKHFIPIVISHIEKADTSHLPEDIKEIAAYNQIKFGNDDSLELLIKKIEECFTPQTVEHRKNSMYLEKLRKIGNEDTYNFNILLREMVITASREEVEEYILPIIESNESADIRFLAFYAVYTFYRRLSYTKDLEELVIKYGEQFSNYKFCNVVYSQFYRHLYEKSGNIDDLKQSVEYAKRSFELIEGNSGVCITYAQAISMALEKSKRKFKKYLPSAMRAVEKSIELKPNYPKSLYTQGVLMGYEGNYLQGIANIEKAIGLEDMEKKDSFIRVIEYKTAISDLKNKQKFVKLKRHLAALYGLLAFLVLLVILLVL